LSSAFPVLASTLVIQIVWLIAVLKTPSPLMSAISLLEEKQVHRAWDTSEQKWVFSIVAYERLEEIENPELAPRRMRHHRRQSPLNTLCVAGTSCPSRLFKLLNHPHPARRGFMASNPGATATSPLPKTT
jgi:hypothetical protein